MEEKHSRRSAMWKILSIAAMLGCFICIGIIVRYIYDGNETKKKYEELSGSLQGDDFQTEQKEALKDTLPPVDSAQEEMESEKAAEEMIMAENPIDFEELQKINPEIYAWIRIPDTNVDYPIVQHEGEDQSYYLYYTIYGEKETAASIYTESLNNKDFSDPNTIIYGHNMKNGSMFHNLRYYADQDYFDEHSAIYIYLPDRILTYEVAASYEYDDRHLLYAFDFSDKEVFAEYLDSVMHPRSMYARINENVELTAEDRIITLSTCIGNKPEARRLVQAVLIDDVEAEYIGRTPTESEESESNR